MDKQSNREISKITSSYIDTNALLRYLLKDNEKQYGIVKIWLTDAKNGNKTIIIVPEVIMEIIFVLEKMYKNPRNEIADIMKQIIMWPYVTIPNREILLNALIPYMLKKTLDFTDCMLLSYVQSTHGILLSFDKRLSTAIHSGKN